MVVDDFDDRLGVVEKYTADRRVGDVLAVAIYIRTLQSMRVSLDACLQCN